MQKTGVVTFSNGEPILDDGTRLAICNDPSPFAAAGRFLRNRGIHDGDTITVTGDDGTIGNVSVFCMTDAQAAKSKVLLEKAAKRAPAKNKSPTKKKASAKKEAPSKKLAKEKTATRSAKRGWR